MASIPGFTDGEIVGLNKGGETFISRAFADKLNKIRDGIRNVRKASVSGRLSLDASGFSAEDEIPEMFRAVLTSDENPYEWEMIDSDADVVLPGPSGKDSAVEYNRIDGLQDEVVWMQRWPGNHFRFQFHREGITEQDPPCTGNTVKITATSIVFGTFDSPPVSGVSVTLKDDLDQTVDSCTTDSQGMCELSYGSPGEFTVEWEYTWSGGGGGGTCSGELPLSIVSCVNPEVNLTICCGKSCVQFIDFDTGQPVDAVPGNPATGLPETSLWVKEGVGLWCREWSQSTGKTDPTAPGPGFATGLLDGYWCSTGLIASDCFTEQTTTVRMYNKDCWLLNPCIACGRCTKGDIARDPKVLPRTLFAIASGGGLDQYNGQELRYDLVDDGGYDWETGCLRDNTFLKWSTGKLAPLTRVQQDIEAGPGCTPSPACGWRAEIWLRETPGTQKCSCTAQWFAGSMLQFLNFQGELACQDTLFATKNDNFDPCTQPPTCFFFPWVHNTEGCATSFLNCRNWEDPATGVTMSGPVDLENIPVFLVDFYKSVTGCNKGSVEGTPCDTFVDTFVDVFEKSCDLGKTPPPAPPPIPFGAFFAGGDSGSAPQAASQPGLPPDQPTGPPPPPP